MQSLAVVMVSVVWWLVLYWMAGHCTAASNRAGWEWRKGNRGSAVWWVVIILFRFGFLVVATVWYVDWYSSHR